MVFSKKDGSNSKFFILRWAK